MGEWWPGADAGRRELERLRRCSDSDRRAARAGGRDGTRVREQLGVRRECDCEQRAVVRRSRCPTAGTYVFETSGAIGACGYALELNTFISVLECVEHGRRIERQHIVGHGEDERSRAISARTCRSTLQPGEYTVQVKGGSFVAECSRRSRPARSACTCEAAADCTLHDKKTGALSRVSRFFSCRCQSGK